MKKILLAAVAVLFSAVLVSAQSDTTSSKNKSQKPKTARTSAGSDSTWYSNYPTQDMVKVKSTDIPASLKNTFQGSEYKGWENGTVYQNVKTHEYSLQLNQPANTATTMKNGGWYRFDQQGKKIPDTRRNP